MQNNKIVLDTNCLLACISSKSENFRNVINAIVESEFVEFIDPQFHLGLIAADHDDDKFVDCAFAANAAYIVSDDSHFDVLKEIPFPHLLVLKLKEFLKRLQEERLSI